MPGPTEETAAAPVTDGAPATRAVKHIIVLYNVETDEIEHGWVFPDAAARDAALACMRESDTEQLRVVAGTDTDGDLVLRAPAWMLCPMCATGEQHDH